MISPDPEREAQPRDKTTKSISPAEGQKVHLGQKTVGASAAPRAGPHLLQGSRRPQKREGPVCLSGAKGHQPVRDRAVHQAHWCPATSSTLPRASLLGGSLLRSGQASHLRSFGSPGGEGQEAQATDTSWGRRVTGPVGLAWHMNRSGGGTRGGRPSRWVPGSWVL